MALVLQQGYAVMMQMPDQGREKRRQGDSQKAGSTTERLAALESGSLSSLLLPLLLSIKVQLYGMKNS